MEKIHFDRPGVLEDPAERKFAADLGQSFAATVKANPAISPSIVIDILCRLLIRVVQSQETVEYKWGGGEYLVHIKAPHRSEETP